MKERKTVQVEPEVKEKLKKLIVTEPNVKTESNMIALLLEHYQTNAIKVPSVLVAMLDELRNELRLETNSQVIFYLLSLCNEKRPELTIAQEKKYIEDAILKSNH